MMKKIIATACLLALLFVPSIILADTFDDAKAAYEKKDYRTAYDLWVPLA